MNDPAREVLQKEVDYLHRDIVAYQSLIDDAQAKIDRLTPMVTLLTASRQALLAVIDQ